MYYGSNNLLQIWKGSEIKKTISSYTEFSFATSCGLCVSFTWELGLSAKYVRLVAMSAGTTAILTINHISNLVVCSSAVYTTNPAAKPVLAVAMYVVFFS